MRARTTGGIALRPTGNKQGSHFFYALNTNKRVTARNWTPLPMPAEVIKYLNKIAHSQKSRKGLRFQLRDNTDAPDNETPEVITAGVAVGDTAYDSDDSDEDDSDYEDKGSVSDDDDMPPLMSRSSSDDDSDDDSDKL